MGRYLREDLAFDAQKGVALGFASNGQLRQPLLLVEAGKVVGESEMLEHTFALDGLGKQDPCD